MKNKGFAIATVLAALLYMSACSSEVSPTPFPDFTPAPVSMPTPDPTSIPTPAAPITVSITVVSDPSLEEITKLNPYAQVPDMVIETYNPDEKLYNTLFHAIDTMESTVDVSQYQLSISEKTATCDSLYTQAGFQFYYLKRIKLSRDGNTVTITYEDTSDEALKNKRLFYLKLNHLVYNVAPENYSPLQKLFAVYDYITENSDYTDNMQDVSTHTAYSILMNGKGICGGFTNLGYYVLNRVGIPTDYIGTEAHVWNMVELDGKKYHTDITWGAGNYGSRYNYLTTILMDDEARIAGLDATGYGGVIIKGYPRVNPPKPSPASHKDFSMYYSLYFEYALDIERNRVFYYDGEGIKQMNLDGKDTTLLSKMPAMYLEAYNGNLYFIHMDNGHLFKLQPGMGPELLDDSIRTEDMEVENGILRYRSISENIEKTLNLNPFIFTDAALDEVLLQPSVHIPLEQSFKFEIEFSADMNTDKLPKEAVGIVNQDGETLPLHMHWNEDGRTLTVRRQVSLENESALTLYVLPGITAADGNAVKEMYGLTVNLN